MIQNQIKTSLTKLLSILILSSLTMLATSCDREVQNKSTHGTKEENSKITAEDLKTDSNGLSQARVILKTVHGNIIFRFYPKKAPNTVTRIIELIQQGFYDGITWHRVVPGFVIQTGDPTATGTGGSGRKLKAEFNDIQHIKGTVAMARAQDVDSADSQFYIALTTLSHLDGKYTVFGQVIDGLEVLEKITQGDKILTMGIEF